MTEDEQLAAVIARCVHELGEHFSSVQILVSRVVEGQTHCVIKGSGDWYARQGLAHEFLNSSRDDDAMEKLAKQIKPNEE
jgi:hypothetical protein